MRWKGHVLRKEESYRQDDTTTTSTCGEKGRDDDKAEGRKSAYSKNVTKGD